MKILTITLKTTGAMMIAAMLLLSAACGGERKTESKAGETKTAEAEETANVETETQTAANAAADVGESFVDTRDSQTYRTVRIGNLTWFAQNLNHQTENSWCYDNDNSNCDKYGRLYTWDAAMKACPSGWRLPSNDDWVDLINATGERDVAGGKLKSRSGWNNNGNGTDDFGFSALPGGAHQRAEFHSLGHFGYWWTTTEAADDGQEDDDYRLALRTYTYYAHTYIATEDVTPKTFAYSVRCVTD